MSDAAPPSILLIHGRNYKPPAEALERLWTDAIRHGIFRDRSDAIPGLDAADVRVAYYGDLSADWLRQQATVRPFDVDADIADRIASLDRLKTLRREDFRRTAYLRMRGRSGLYEAIADSLERPLRWLGVGDRTARSYAPELAEYWTDAEFGRTLRSRVVGFLREAMQRGGPIAIVGHSLGALIAYDLCWMLSHDPELAAATWNRPVDLLLTLGGPLGNATIRANLKGTGQPPGRRYPTNVCRWHNVAAEDDIIAHDEDLADDFAAMEPRPRDHRIYNPSIRRGVVNPHYIGGYLMNPVVVELLADWLLDPALDLAVDPESVRPDRPSSGLG